MFVLRRIDDLAGLPVMFRRRGDDLARFDLRNSIYASAYAFAVSFGRRHVTARDSDTAGIPDSSGPYATGERVSEWQAGRHDGSPPNTFQKSNSTTPPGPTTVIPGNNSGLVLPALIGPENRTTALPVHQASYFQLIASPPKTAPVRTAKLDDSGWRASHD